MQPERSRCRSRRDRRRCRASAGFAASQAWARCLCGSRIFQLRVRPPAGLPSASARLHLSSARSGRGVGARSRSASEIAPRRRETGRTGGPAAQLRREAAPRLRMRRDGAAGAGAAVASPSASAGAQACASSLLDHHRLGAAVAEVLADVAGLDRPLQAQRLAPPPRGGSCRSVSFVSVMRPPFKLNWMWRQAPSRRPSPDAQARPVAPEALGLLIHRSAAPPCMRQHVPHLAGPWPNSFVRSSIRRR